MMDILPHDIFSHPMQETGKELAGSAGVLKGKDMGMSVLPHFLPTIWQKPTRFK